MQNLFDQKTKMPALAIATRMPTTECCGQTRYTQTKCWQTLTVRLKKSLKCKHLRLSKIFEDGRHCCRPMYVPFFRNCLV
jgi:hypothetical protein